MKVCLVAASSLEMAPYVKKYALLCQSRGLQYDIISKEPSTAPRSDNEFIFYYGSAKSPIGKLRRFLAYARHIRKIIRTKHYDKLIIFTGMNASFCQIALKKELKKIPYMVDIRDYDKSFKSPVLSPFLRRVLRSAGLVVLSSAKFKDWIPDISNVCVMHNLPLTMGDTQHRSFFEKDTVRIAYLGGVGYFHQNKAIVDALKEQTNIQLIYRGIYPNEYNIRDYCSENNIQNVTFYGKYNDEDKPDLYQQVDIINAVYGNGSLIVTTALPNKLYDCVAYKIPIMVCTGTYLEEIVQQYNLGFSIDPQKPDEIAPRISVYIQSFEPARFLEGCDAFLKIAENEQKETESKIEKMLL